MSASILIVGAARADETTCNSSEIGQRCAGDGGGASGLTCLQVTTTTTFQDGGTSSATAPTCVFISGTYCDPSAAGQACGPAGDVCVAETEGSSSGSTGGGEQTSATSYTYGVCQALPPDAGDPFDDSGVAIANGSSDGGSGVTTAAPSADGGTPNSEGDSGLTAEPSSGDSSSSGGCTIAPGAANGFDSAGLCGLLIGSAMVAQRRRRGRHRRK